MNTVLTEDTWFSAVRLFIDAVACVFFSRHQAIDVLFLQCH